MNARSTVGVHCAHCDDRIVDGDPYQFEATVPLCDPLCHAEWLEDQRMSVAEERGL